jgi:iron complex outermembrane recepter protein
MKHWLKYSALGLGLVQQVAFSQIQKEKEIDGVSITKRKKAIEQKADRTVFDFSEQPQLNTGSTLEGIKKLPGLLHSDAAGMMYQGKLLDVFLNGRPTGMKLSDLNAFLEGMPANSVDRIEVITSPGAEFPATSGGAILNIITNSNAAKFLSASISSNYSFSNEDVLRHKTNNSLSLNGKNSWFGWKLQLGQSYKPGWQNYQLIDKNSGDKILHNETNRFPQSYFINSGLIIDFETDKLMLNYDTRWNIGRSDISALKSLSAPNPSQFTSHSNYQRHDAEAVYQMRFENKVKKLDFKAYFNIEQNDFEQNLTQPMAFNMLNNGSEKQMGGLKVDFSYPVNFLDDSKINLGALYQSTFFKAQNRGQRNFEYHNQETDVYAEFHTKYKRVSLVAGLRGEEYKINGLVYDALGRSSKLIPFEQYRLFPNVNLQYDIWNRLILGATYNQKIALPAVSNLNPNNTTFSSAVFGKIGNPNILPTLSHNYELKLSMLDYIFMSYSRSDFNNLMVQDLAKTGPGSYLSQDKNLSDFRIESFNMGMPLPYMLFSKGFKESFKFNVNIDDMNYVYIYYSYQKHRSKYFIEQPNLQILSLIGHFNLPYDIKFAPQYNYVSRGRYQNVVATEPFNQTLDLNLSKQYLDKRLKIAIFANDVLRTSVQSFDIGQAPDLIGSFTRADTRTFGLSITYKFKQSNKLIKEPNAKSTDEKEKTNIGL